MAFLTGGNWNNGVNAGMFNLNVNNAATNRNTNIGFRTMLGLLRAIKHSSLIPPREGKYKRKKLS